MEMHVVAFFLWHSSKRLLIDIRQPSEELRKGPERLWIATNKDARRELRDFEITADFWAWRHVVDPRFQDALDHMKFSKLGRVGLRECSSAGK
jgi:hypothetical protein